MELGWIKIHRKLLEWEWYDEPNTFRLFIHLLLKANHKEKRWQGVKIRKGEVMTGQAKLADELGLTRRKVRTALNNLESTNEIAIKTNTKGTIIQVITWDDYQVTPNETTNQRPTNDQAPTNERPTSDQRPTTNKKEKNVKNDKNDEEDRKKSDFEFKLIDIDKLPIIYLKNKRVVDAVVKNSKNKFRNANHLKERLKEFVETQIGNGVLNKTLADFSSHFRYWHIKSIGKKIDVDNSNSNIPIG